MMKLDSPSGVSVPVHANHHDLTEYDILDQDDSALPDTAVAKYVEAVSEGEFSIIVPLSLIHI